MNLPERATRCGMALAVFCLTCGAARSAPTAPKKGSDVIATVNGVQITKTQIATELMSDQWARLNATNAAYKDRARPVAASLGALVLKNLESRGTASTTVTRDQLVAWLFEDKPPILYDALQTRIRELAIEQAAKKQGIALTQAEVKEQLSKSIANAKKQLKMDGKTDAQLLKDIGYRPETIRSGIAASLCLDHMVRREVAKKLGRPIGPGDYLDARHILIKVNAAPPAPGPDGTPQPAGAADLEKAFAEGRTKIAAIAADISSGKKTFEKSASESSDDGSKFKEGKLDVFVRGQMVPEFEAAAFALAPGKVSEPVRSQFGWHLIRVDRVGASIPAADRETAWQGFVRGRAQGLVQQIVSSAKVVNKLGQPPAPPMRMPGQ